jgi:hypothetical protein
MGYAGFSLNQISRPLLPRRHDRGNGGSRFWLTEGRIDHGGKLNHISAFLQENDG